MYGYLKKEKRRLRQMRTSHNNTLVYLMPIRLKDDEMSVSLYWFVTKGIHLGLQCYNLFQLSY